MKNYNQNILNLFLFIVISTLHIIKAMKHIMQIQRKMMIVIHMFILLFPGPSSYLGKRSFQTSIEPDLDMIRK